MFHSCTLCLLPLLLDCLAPFLSHFSKLPSSLSLTFPLSFFFLPSHLPFHPLILLSLLLNFFCLPCSCVFCLPSCVSLPGDKLTVFSYLPLHLHILFTPSVHLNTPLAACARPRSALCWCGLCWMSMLSLMSQYVHCSSACVHVTVWVSVRMCMGLLRLQLMLIIHAVCSVLPTCTAYFYNNSLVLAFLYCRIHNGLWLLSDVM